MSGTRKNLGPKKCCVQKIFIRKHLLFWVKFDNIWKGKPEQSISNLEHIDGDSGNVTADEDDDDGDENGSNFVVSSASGLVTSGADSLAGVGKNTVDMTVETTEEDEGQENHDEEVTDEDVIPTVSEL